MPLCAALRILRCRHVCSGHFPVRGPDRGKYRCSRRPSRAGGSAEVAAVAEALGALGIAVRHYSAQGHSISAHVPIPLLLAVAEFEHVQSVHKVTLIPMPMMS